MWGRSGSPHLCLFIYHHINTFLHTHIFAPDTRTMLTPCIRCHTSKIVGYTGQEILSASAKTSSSDSKYYNIYNSIL